MKFVLLLSVLGMLSACSNSSSSGGGSPAAGIPDDLKMESVASEPLTEANLKTVKEYLKSNDAKIPSASLIYGLESDATSEDRSSYKEQMSALDSVGRANLKLAQSKCRIKNSEKKTTQTWGNQAPKAGDSSTSTSFKSISGSGCPVEDQSQSEFKMTFTEFSLNSARTELVRYSYDIAGSMFSKGELKDDTWIELNSGLTAFEIDLKINGSGDGTPDGSRILVALAGKQKLISNSGKSVTGEVKAKSLTINKNSPASSVKKEYYEYKIFYPNFTLVIQTLKDSSDSSKNEIRVNGRSVSKKELKELIGTGNFSGT